jgi:hypothetical protein
MVNAWKDLEQCEHGIFASDVGLFKEEWSNKPPSSDFAQDTV